MTDNLKLINILGCTKDCMRTYSEQLIKCDQLEGQEQSRCVTSSFTDMMECVGVMSCLPEACYHYANAS